MIEFVKLIVDVVLRTVPGLVGRNERDKAAHLGASLFLIYIELNDVLVRAEEIVTLMERYVQDSDGDHDSTRRQLMHLVPKQTADIRTVTERMKDLSWEFRVLDNQSFLALEFLVNMKTSALDLLDHALTLDQLPLTTTSLALDKGGLRWPESSNSVAALDAHRKALLDDLDLDNTTRDDEPRRIRTYLARRKPREELAAIRENLGRLREAIAASFSIQDILVRAGDPRLGRRRIR